LRLNNARAEMAKKDFYDELVLNDDFARTVNDVLHTIDNRFSLAK
jgi:guanylate kinase